MSKSGASFPYPRPIKKVGEGRGTDNFIFSSPSLCQFKRGDFDWASKPTSFQPSFQKQSFWPEGGKGQGRPIIPKQSFGISIGGSGGGCFAGVVSSLSNSKQSKMEGSFPRTITRASLGEGNGEKAARPSSPTEGRERSEGWGGQSSPLNPSSSNPLIVKNEGFTDSPSSTFQSQSSLQPSSQSTFSPFQTSPPSPNLIKRLGSGFLSLSKSEAVQKNKVFLEGSDQSFQKQSFWNDGKAGEKVGKVGDSFFFWKERGVQSYPRSNSKPLVLNGKEDQEAENNNKPSFYDDRPGKGVRSSRTPDNKGEVVSITYEEIGLFPRSFSRVLDRFLKQVFSDVENLVVREYRFYRYLFLTTLKCLLILFFVPFFVNWIAKTYVVRPLTEYFWNGQQTEIFLNSYQQKRAFRELKDFEEKLYFESLVYPKTAFSKEKKGLGAGGPLGGYSGRSKGKEDEKTESLINAYTLKSSLFVYQTIEADKNIQQRYQEKTIELAQRYNDQSIEAITNFFADLISLLTLFYLLYALEIQINITKSFLLEVFFGLDDSKKSLLILLVTDLLVGYHSSNLWELFFEFLFNHYGLPESQTGIFLLVATLPVLLDVLFKYLIFRHLNRSSPATVATYHAMIE
jgi:hypothetical protein